MSNSGSGTISVACTATSPKADLPDWICPLFVERLSNVYPERSFEKATDSHPEVELLVDAMSSRRFSGQIRWGSQMGEPRAAMLSGGTLGPEILARTLDQLIAVTPSD